MKIAIQMDPLKSLNTDTDSTLVLQRAAHENGYETLYYEPKDLSYNDGEVVANFRNFSDEEIGRKNLKDFDVVLIRQDPPYDMAYLTATYFLSLICDQVKVLNDPGALRNNPEKIIPLHFKEFCPPTVFSNSYDRISEFADRHGEIVLKPMYGYGGKNVFKINSEKENLKALIESMNDESDLPVIAQKFIPEVAISEKRVIIIDAEIIGAFQRKPEIGEIRSNMRVGGKPHKCDLSEKETVIIEKLCFYLKKENIFFCGADVISDFLIEANVTSPTGLKTLDEIYGISTGEIFWDRLNDRCG